MADQLNNNVRITANDGVLSLSAYRARLILMWIVRIFALGIVVQVFLAGLAIFVDSANWAAHSSFPRYFAFLPIIMIVLTFFTKLPVSVRIKCFQLIGMIILMFLTAVLSSKIGILSALHPVIAIMLFMTSTSIVNQIGASQKTHKGTTVSNSSLQ
jgi:hypothetical protein